MPPLNQSLTENVSLWWNAIRSSERSVLRSCKSDEKKIQDGKVKGITDPNEASKIVEREILLIKMLN